MGNILQWLTKMAKGRNLLVLFLVFVICYYFINGVPFGVAALKQITNGIGILDMNFGYSAEHAYIHLDSLGEEGRAFYLMKILPLDVVFPASYALFLSTAIMYLWKKSAIKNERLQLLCLIPVITAVIDYMENAMIAVLTISFPKSLPNLAALGGIVTMTKWIFFSVTIGVGILGVCVWLFKNHKGRKPCYEEDRI